jgi:hypothetical protein
MLAQIEGELNAPDRAVISWRWRGWWTSSATTGLAVWRLASLLLLFFLWMMMVDIKKDHPTQASGPDETIAIA